jgi:hypothetical protein
LTTSLFVENFCARSASMVASKRAMPPGAAGMSTARLQRIFGSSTKQNTQPPAGDESSVLSWDRTKRGDTSADGDASLRGSVMSSRVGLRGTRASPEEAAAAYEQADTTLNFTSDRLTSIAKLSSVRSSGGGTSVEGSDAADSEGAFNMNAKRLASIAKGMSTTAVAQTKRTASVGSEETPPAAPVLLGGSVMGSQGAGRAQPTSRRSTLTPAETVVGLRGVAADTIGQSVESLRAKLRTLTDERATGAREGALGFDVTPHMDSLAAMSSQHVQQKRQEIAYAQSALDKATEEIRLCKEQEAAEFDSKVGVLRGEFERQMGQLEREFVMHAERYAAQLQSAVEQCHEQHDRSLQRRTEVLLYSLTHPPPPHPTEMGGTMHGSMTMRARTEEDVAAQAALSSSGAAGSRGAGGARGRGGGGVPLGGVVIDGHGNGSSSLPSTISVASGGSETAESIIELSQQRPGADGGAAASGGAARAGGSPLSPRSRVAAWNVRGSSIISGSATPNPQQQQSQSQSQSLSHRSGGDQSRSGRGIRRSESSDTAAATAGRESHSRTARNTTSASMSTSKSVRSAGGMSGLNGGLDYAPSPSAAGSALSASASASASGFGSPNSRSATAAAAAKGGGPGGSVAASL